MIYIAICPSCANVHARVRARNFLPVLREFNRLRGIAEEEDNWKYYMSLEESR